MEKEKCKEDEGSTCLWMLPEECITKILALTSPPDVCRFSMVTPSFRLAADSDLVWTKFLPSDYRSIIAGSPTPVPDFRSLKDLYVYLSHQPLLIDEGRKSFSLDKWSGKKRYFLGARDVNISWDVAPKNWRWISLPESRFPEVAQLKGVCWLEVCCTIRVGILSPLTFYTAYFVYKLGNRRGFQYPPSVVSIGISGVESEKRYVSLLSDYSDDKLTMRSPWSILPEYRNSSYMHVDKHLPKLRDDGWLELQLGEFFTGNEDDCVEMRMQGPQGGFYEHGLIIEGIEIRPIVC